MFTLSFSTGGSAFDDDPTIEVVRLLKLVASQVERGSHSGTVLDINGNSVGNWVLDRV